ncbi:unnamed protein product [Rangifer tarandus platyrhynchus]|uniref:Uncharacterized protein n=2 Tax=Rangifer tarandus platyrhynchus TaxID=3082113 RepID=A0ACB0FEE0_RANTA|nr:unnamed protein product [Rangifer tarandus platyrhynchus]CAI9711193.1 unnamed protein product [Rangifer tarandus platyrhynchus]
MGVTGHLGPPAFTPGLGEGGGPEASAGQSWEQGPSKSPEPENPSREGPHALRRDGNARRPDGTQVLTCTFLPGERGVCGRDRRASWLLGARRDRGTRGRKGQGVAEPQEVTHRA